ncbi:hypothetical protein [Fructobacillus tropaeoli]|uniref:hypothetical protein n=1 Tax=Fructobacillus tropaeoli TaxID=709323 RepID=UPI001945A3CB|nr:hypothetical protein [Fructobacillus tropaeoli]
MKVKEKMMQQKGERSMLLLIMILVFAIGIFMYVTLVVGYFALTVIFLILKLIVNVISDYLSMRRTKDIQKDRIRH